MMRIRHFILKIISSILFLLIVTATQAEMPQDPIHLTSHKASGMLTTIPNLELSALSQAELLGPIDPQKEITFTVWLKLRNKKQLHQLVSDLYSPQSIQYQSFLTYKQFDNQYSPKPST